MELCSVITQPRPPHRLCPEPLTEQVSQWKYPSRGGSGCESNLGGSQGGLGADIDSSSVTDILAEALAQV